MAVDVRRKRHAFFFDIAQLRERENLKSAAVRQYRAVPAGKLAYAAHFAHHVIARAQMQVVRVGEHHLTFNIFKVVSRNRTLNRRSRRDVHKRRCLHRAVHGLELAAPRVVFSFDKLVHVKKIPFKVI